MLLRKAQFRRQHEQQPGDAAARETITSEESDRPLAAGGGGDASSGGGVSCTRPELGWVVVLLHTLVPLVRILQLPSWLWGALLASGAAFTARRALNYSRPYRRSERLYRGGERWHRHNERPYRWHFLRSLGLAVAAFAFENFASWCVSAGYQGKHSFVHMQDNAREALLWAAANSDWARWCLVDLRWSDIWLSMAALLALPLSVLWDQVPYSALGMMSRITRALALGRMLRVACFTCTVRPSAIEGCYEQRFPPVPHTWAGVVRVGFSRIRGEGGCNDLMFSGHCAFWTLAPLAYRSYYSPLAACGSGAVHRGAQALLWAALAHMCAQDIIMGRHYSIDMLIALLVQTACWTWTEPAYAQERQDLPMAAPGKPGRLVAISIAAVALAGLFLSLSCFAMGRCKAA